MQPITQVPSAAQQLLFTRRKLCPDLLHCHLSNDRITLMQLGLMHALTAALAEKPIASSWLAGFTTTTECPPTASLFAISFAP